MLGIWGVDRPNSRHLKRAPGYAELVEDFKLSPSFVAGVQAEHDAGVAFERHVNLGGGFAAEVGVRRQLIGRINS